MKHKFLLVIAVLLPILAGISCNKVAQEGKEEPEEEIVFGPIRLADAETKVALRSNGFGLDMFQALTDANEKKDLLFSPLGLSLNLSLCAGGAAGETQRQLLAAIGFEDMPADATASFFQKVTTGLQRVDPKVSFRSANAIWADLPYSLKKDYVSYAEEYYSAEIASLDLGKKESLSQINAWCKEKTDGLIPQLLNDRADPTVKAASYLANALYFKGSWTFDFDKDMPEDVFHGVEGDRKATYLKLYQEGGIGYGETENAQLVSIPYGDKFFALVLALPKEGISLSEMLSSLEPEDFSLHHIKDTVDIRLPKFQVSYNAGDELVSALKQKGVTLPFQQGKADFSGMFENSAPFYIESLLQKSVISVDEKGTEAAAATFSNWASANFTPEEPQFHTVVFDRPFVFAVVEQSSWSILFLGQKVR